MDEEFSKFLEEVKDIPVIEEATEASINNQPDDDEEQNKSISTVVPTPSENINKDETDECFSKSDEKDNKEKIEGEAIKNETSEPTKLNKTEETSPKESTSEDHSKHTRYEGCECIYTNPENKQEYVWSTEMNQWVPRGYKPVLDGDTYKYTNAEGVTFKWVAESSTWEKSDETGPEVKQPQYGFDGENHTYTDPKDNTVYIWDREKNAWFPNVDEDFMAKYQLSYGFVDNTSPDVKEPEPEKKAEKRKPSQPAWFELDDQQNTKVYVSNLPCELSEKEFVDFMQKCGLVLKDLKTNKFKVKLYREPDGTFKGDALCDYIKIESVDLALKVLDGADLKGKKVKIQRAKFQMKGDYNPALKPKKKKKKELEQEKKIQQKLLDWRPDKFRGEREKHERTVVLKNLFTPSLFDNNVELILEFTEDIRSEAEKCGIVRKVVLYDKNPEGVATITFSDAEEADICIKLLNNRWFGKRQVIAETWDGKTKFKIVENAQETAERLDKWNKFLESEDRIKQ